RRGKSKKEKGKRRQRTFFLWPFSFCQRRTKAKGKRPKEKGTLSPFAFFLLPSSYVGVTRQTLAYLRNLFESRGIKPKNKLGQNFLIDLNLLDVLLRAAELTHADLAVEVGSGTGSLTARLAEVAGAVLSVELDAAFYEMTREVVAARPNVVLLHAD